MELLHGDYLDVSSEVLSVESSSVPMSGLGALAIDDLDVFSALDLREFRARATERVEVFVVGGVPLSFDGLGVGSLFAVRAETDECTLTVCSRRWSATRDLERIFGLEDYRRGRAQLIRTFAAQQPDR